MKLNSFLKIFLCLMVVTSLGFSQTRKQVNISFKDLKIEDFIKLTSKILGKNILLTKKVNGTVNFVSTKPIYQDELLDIVQSVLASKGFTLVKNDSFLEIVKLSDASTYNLPVVKNVGSNKQMLTQAIKIRNQDVNSAAKSIRHLVSKSAKLVIIDKTNSLLLTDFPENVKTVQKVIKMIENNSKKKISFIKLENVKVKKIFTNISKIIKDMFNPKIQDEKITVIENIDANLLVVIGLEKYIKKVTNIVKKFDIQDKKTMQEVKIIALKNSTAENTFKAVNFIIKAKKYPTPAATPVISVDADTNSLIVLGPKDAIKDIQKIIQELDREKPQVYVKAQIIEVNEDLTDKLGVKYGFESGAISGSGLFNMAANFAGSPIAVSKTLSSLVTLNSGVKQGLILGATVDFLKNNSAANIISEPSILCINNKESSIFVGGTKSIESTSTTGSTVTTSQSREDAGLTLKVKPLISNDNKVTLEVTTILEDFVPLTSTQKRPDTSKKEVKTVAIVRNGENVIVGGLIKAKENKIESKIPVLGDVPILGHLFKHNELASSRQNLIIILTPYIIEASSDLSTLRKKLYNLDKIKAKVSKNLEKYLQSRENNVSN